MFTSLAYAAGAPAGGAEGGAQGLLVSLMPLILMFAVFYFLLIRPQQKRAKTHRAMLAALGKGDHVITTGGMMGRITDVEGDILSVDLGSTVVKVARGFINGTYDPKAIGRVGADGPAEQK